MWRTGSKEVVNVGEVVVICEKRGKYGKWKRIRREGLGGSGGSGRSIDPLM
jgi:hypothetical protein